jgi:hypothetical protein
VTCDVWRVTCEQQYVYINAVYRLYKPDCGPLAATLDAKEEEEEE